MRIPVPMQFGREFGRVGERGHFRRRDEGRRLHLADAGGGYGGKQFKLGGQRDWILDLQPVAQRHVANVHVRRQFSHSTPSSRSAASSASVRPSSSR